jgi:DNA-binding transcriptional LysR family regulator
MDIEKINTVLAVAHTHSFSEAALDINLSQSSVTKHVLSVERELNTPLFLRTNTHKSVELTDAGKTFIEYGRQISDLYQELSDKISKRPTKVKTSLTLNMIPMPGIFSQASILSTVYLKHPDLSVSITRKSLRDVLKALQNREMDAAVFRPIFENGEVLPPESLLYHHDIVIHEICANPAIIAVNKEHRLAGCPFVTLPELKHERFLVQSPNSPGKNMQVSSRVSRFIQSCVHEGFEPIILPNIDPTGIHQGETNINLVARGVGVMLINVKMPRNIPNVELIPLHGLTWEAKTVLASLKGYRTKVIQQLVACLREMTNDQ